MPNIETQAYWDAVKEGRLLLKQCAACGKVHHFPRALCPFCFSEKTRWVDSPGRGRIYSWTVMRRGEPNALAYVELDEGPRMLGQIVQCDFDALEVNQRVHVVFVPDDQGVPRPCFTPSTSD